MEEKIAKVSGLIYTGISLGLALVFLVLTYLTGEDYTLITRIGGTIWVFILGLIITMPVVIPYVKKKYAE